MTKEEFIQNLESYKTLIIPEIFNSLLKKADELSDTQRDEIIKKAEETKNKITTELDKVNEVKNHLENANKDLKKKQQKLFSDFEEKAEKMKRFRQNN